MWSYIVTGGFCFLTFIPPVTLLILQNALEVGDELEADEKEACALDKDCDPTTATKQLRVAREHSYEGGRDPARLCCALLSRVSVFQ